MWSAASMSKDPDVRIIQIQLVVLSLFVLALIFTEAC